MRGGLPGGRDRLRFGAAILRIGETSAGRGAGISEPLGRGGAPTRERRAGRADEGCKGDD